MNELMNGLDVYFGRDNGIATFSLLPRIMTASYTEVMAT